MGFEKKKPWKTKSNIWKVVQHRQYFHCMNNDIYLMCAATPEPPQDLGLSSAKVWKEILTLESKAVGYRCEETRNAVFPA